MADAHSKTPIGAPLVARLGFTSILIGVALALIGPWLFDGFVKGLFIGAGLALVVLGVVAVNARRRTGHSDLWLPSRDDE